MLNTINSDLIRGNINTIILKALFDGDRYGYDIVKEIEQKSSGQYKLKQPTLYSCLKRLEVQGFIRSYWGAKSSGGRRKYYTLTDMGRELFIKNQTEWEYSRTVIDKLISDREYDLSKTETNANDDYESEAADAEDTQTENEEELAETNDVPDDEEYNEEQIPAEKEEAPSENFDTQSILSRLFESQSGNGSYTDKLISEEYKVGERVNSENYFKNYSEENLPSEDGGAYYDDLSEEEAETEADATQDGAYGFTENGCNETEKSEALFPDPETPQDAATANNFISYRARVNDYDDDKNLLEREYKNVLGKLVDGDVEQKTEQIPKPAYIPLSDEMAENIARIEAENDVLEKETASTAAIINQTNPRNVLDQGLTTISDDALRSTGDTVRTRVHDDKAAASYNTQYHYYSNKLMLVQYAILFGIMILETIFTFLLVRVGLKIISKYDVYTYVIAVIVSLAFPVTAAIKNFTDPQKTKRYDYDFKNAMIFRIWITVCCLIIIYCINIFLEMPLSFSKEYLSSLLLPVLLVLNIPINAVLFKILHGTGKFNQTY